jgi:hypothetical protein
MIFPPENILKDAHIINLDNKLVILQSEHFNIKKIQEITQFIKERKKKEKSTFLLMGKNDLIGIFQIDNGKLISKSDFNKEAFIQSLQKVIKEMKKQ